MRIYWPKPEAPGSIGVPFSFPVIHDDQASVHLGPTPEIGPVETFQVFLGALSQVEESNEGLGDQVPRSPFQDGTPGPTDDVMGLGTVDLVIFESNEGQGGMLVGIDPQFLL